jgi:hypothetical protein
MPLSAALTKEVLTIPDPSVFLFALIRPSRIPCFTSAPNAQHARLWLACADELIKLKPLSHLTVVKRL